MLRAPQKESSDQSVSELISRLYSAFESKNVEQLGQLLDLLDDRMVPHTSPLVLSDLGVMCRFVGDSERAVRFYRRVLMLLAEPPPYVLSNFGNALKDVKRFAEAEHVFRLGLMHSPADASLWHNYGLSLAADARYAEAVGVFRHALTLPSGGNKGAINWDMSRALLVQGLYAEGGKRYAARWLLPDFAPQRPHYSGKNWDGRCFEGQHLLLWPEQGFGDTIQCLRFVHDVCAMGSKVSIVLVPELMSLAQAQHWPDNLQLVPEEGAHHIDCDWHAPMMDLMTVFTSNASKIPGANGYLEVPCDREDTLALFRAQRNFSSACLHIGIVWSGSVDFAGNRDRACDLGLFLQYLNLPGVQLYSLQKGPRELDLHEHPESSAVIDLAPLLNDFADTAAVVSQLDLVIMTDSSVAHLCGALGVPVWVLLAKNAHWLWLQNRDDSPWCRSMHFFRQEEHGDWRGVFDRVSATVLEWVQPTILP